MSALGKLVVSLALNHAEYTQGLDRSSQEALKFAQNSQKSFDQAEQSAKEFFSGVAAGAVGVIGSIVGIDAAITRTKQNIDILASLDDAAQKTGSSVEDLSRIQKTAKNFGDDFGAIEQSISRLAKGLGSFDDEGNQAMRALDAIGVSARDSNDQQRASAAVYIDVAKALQQYKDGAEKAAVVNALFGKSGVDQLPILNNLSRGIDDVTASSAGSAQQADEFNDALARSSAAVDNIFGQLAVDLLPTLLGISSAINTTSGEMRDFGSANSAVVITLKALVLTGFTIIDTFNGVARSLGAAVGQFVALSTMDMDRFFEIEEELNRMNKESGEEFDKFFDTVLNGDQKLAAAVNDGGMKKTIDFALNMPAAVNASTQAIEKQTKAFDIELHKLKEYESEAKRARDITESVATKQERYNQTLEELERLRPHMSVEAYTRALDKAERELQDVGAVNRQVTSEMDQLWIQAGRNIQSTFANSIFDFFNDGVDGMWRNAKSAVGRILSEFAALKLSQSIGLNSLFTGGGIGGAGSAGVSSFGVGDILNTVSGIPNSIKGGFGSLIGRGASALGFSSFGAGASGAASAGVFGAGGLNYLGGAGTALGAGAEFGSMASLGAMSGPLMAGLAGAGVGFMGGSALAGDKKVFGMSGNMTSAIGTGIGMAIGGPFGAAIGGLIGGGVNALFGFGPRKFRQEVAIGDVSAEGFDGRFTRVDRAKAGLLAGKNKHWEYDSPDSAAFNEVFDAAIKGYAASAQDFAKNLGLSTDAVTGYSKTIRLESEKGKALTEEQITSFLRGIGNEFAQGIMPTVDTLKKAGEDSLTTLGRLSTEFTTLSDAATILGKSVAESRAFVSGASFEGRSGFVEAAGGIEALSQKAAFFAQNFMTDAARLAPAQERLNDELRKLNLSADLTKDQFSDLVQSFGQVNGISEDTLQALLNLQGGFLEVRNTSESLAAQAEEQAKAQVNNAYSALQKSVETERNRITEQYNAAVEESSKRIQNVTESIGKLKTLSDALRSTVDAIHPLGRGQAKQQIQDAINEAKRGGMLPDADSLRNALGVLGNSDSINAAKSSFDFALEQAKTASLIDELNSITDSQLTLEQRSLAALEAQRDRLDAGFDGQIARLDSLLEQGQREIDSLNGVNTAVLALTQAIGGFNLRLAQVGGAPIYDPLTGLAAVSGNPNVSDQEIRDFIKQPGLSDMDIYNAARKHGISFGQYAAATGSKLDDLKGWAKQRGLPTFASGGFHRGGLRIVGERGPELESTGSANITSNSDLRKLLNNDGVVSALTQLLVEMKEMKASGIRTAKILEAVTQNGTTLRTKAA